LFLRFESRRAIVDLRISATYRRALRILHRVAFLASSAAGYVSDRKVLQFRPHPRLCSYGHGKPLRYPLESLASPGETHSMPRHYTYLLISECARWYIGVRSCPLHISSPEFDDGYMGSFRDKNIRIQQKFVLTQHGSRDAALTVEMLLHEYYDVARNPAFWNRAKQTSIGFDRTGIPNPNAGRPAGQSIERPSDLTDDEWDQYARHVKQLAHGKMPLSFAQWRWRCRIEASPHLKAAGQTLVRPSDASDDEWGKYTKYLDQLPHGKTPVSLAQWRRNVKAASHLKAAGKTLVRPSHASDDEWGKYTKYLDQLAGGKTPVSFSQWQNIVRAVQSREVGKHTRVRLQDVGTMN